VNLNFLAARHFLAPSLNPLSDKWIEVALAFAASGFDDHRSLMQKVL
jgi:hypothetical protein